MQIYFQRFAVSHHYSRRFHAIEGCYLADVANDESRSGSNHHYLTVEVIVDWFAPLWKSKALSKLDVREEISFDSYEDKVRNSAAEKGTCVERSNHSQNL